MRRAWIKLWVDQCLRGSMIDELTPAQRWLWFGFLLMAGDSSRPGMIFRRLDAGHVPVGYSPGTLAEILDVPLAEYEDGIARMVKADKIRLDERGVIFIVNWSKYQSEYQRQKPYRQARKKGASKKGDRRSYKKGDKQGDKQGDALDLDLEGDIEREREKEGRAYAQFGPLVRKVFESAGYKFDERTIVYVAGLCAEFPALHHENELKRKIAWWANHPLTPKSNVCLQVRNWFIIAQKDLEERRAETRVGEARPRDPGEDGDRAAYDGFLAELARAQGLPSAENLDPFKTPSFPEYRKLRASKPAILEALLRRPAGGTP